MEEEMEILVEMQQQLYVFAHSWVGIVVQGILGFCLFAMIIIPDEKSGTMFARRNTPTFSVFCSLIVFGFWVVPSLSLESWYGLFAMAGLLFIGLVIPEISAALHKAKSPKNAAANNSFSRSN